MNGSMSAKYGSVNLHNPLIQAKRPKSNIFPKKSSIAIERPYQLQMTKPSD